MTEIFDILLPIDTERRFYNNSSTIADRDFLMEMVVDRIANKYRGEAMTTRMLSIIEADANSILAMFSLLRRWSKLPILKLKVRAYRPPIFYWADDDKFLESELAI